MSGDRVKKGLIVAFGELFLKSEGVRNLLIEGLMNNISALLKRRQIGFSVIRMHPRLFIETGEIKQAKEVLRWVFGISWFSPSFLLEGADLRDLVEFVDENYKRWIETGERFAIRVKRGGDESIDRSKVIDSVAENIEREVDLDNPDKTLFLEKRKPGWFVYINKDKGAGGLPVGSEGKAITLISGGIDSPVASYLSMKRGVENVWLHFHSFPLVSKKSIEKTRDLAETFLRFQPTLKVLFVPFAEVQKKIKAGAPSKYRVLLYRRAMLKAGGKLLERVRGKALVTGESLGQVSSQTLDNMTITNRSVEFPILRPLIGMDKQEIIQLAREMGSYEISIRPQEDCCTLFVSKGQTAEGDLDKVLEVENRISLDDLCDEIVKSTEVEVFS